MVRRCLAPAELLLDSLERGEHYPRLRIRVFTGVLIEYQSDEREPWYRMTGELGPYEPGVIRAGVITPGVIAAGVILARR
jgi:hypothetical protein